MPSQRNRFQEGASIFIFRARELGANQTFFLTIVGRDREPVGDRQFFSSEEAGPAWGVLPLPIIQTAGDEFFSRIMGRFLDI